MYVVAVGSAFPPHYYDQETLLGAIRAQWSGRHHNVRRLDRLHRAVLVGGRHLALPLEAYERLETFGDSNQAWLRVGLDVGEAAVRDALERAGLPWSRMGVFMSTTVTGVAAPSLEARLLNRVELPRAVRRLPLFGLGCLAGAAGIARVADLLRGMPDEAGLLLSVELCSLTIQRDDVSVANLISSGLFGDGAACVVMAGEALAREVAAARELPGPGSLGPRVVATRSVFYPDTEEIMGWDVRETGFRVVLSAGVPDVARQRLRPHVDAFLAEQGLTLSDIDSWVCHPGGPKVLRALQEGFELPDEALELSWRSLRELGNLSSSSVLMVLRDTLYEARPPAGTLGLLLAMGPGFSSEIVLLEW